MSRLLACVVRFPFAIALILAMLGVALAHSATQIDSNPTNISAALAHTIALPLGWALAIPSAGHSARRSGLVSSS